MKKLGAVDTFLLEPELSSCLAGFQFPGDFILSSQKNLLSQKRRRFKQKKTIVGVLILSRGNSDKASPHQFLVPANGYSYVGYPAGSCPAGTACRLQGSYREVLTCHFLSLGQCCESTSLRRLPGIFLSSRSLRDPNPLSNLRHDPSVQLPECLPSRPVRSPCQYPILSFLLSTVRVDCDQMNRDTNDCTSGHFHSLPNLEFNHFLFTFGLFTVPTFD